MSPRRPAPPTARPTALVDANVVLRFITRAPTRQAEAAARLFARAQRGDVDLVLLAPVVAEVVYVLEGVYAYGSERVERELTALFDTGCFKWGNDETIRRALSRRVTTPVDFVDAYLAELARHQGVSVATFDRDFGRLDAELMEVT